MHNDEVVDIVLRFKEASTKLLTLRKEMEDVVSQLEHAKQQMMAATTRARTLQNHWAVLHDRANELREEVLDLEQQSRRLLGENKDE